MVILCKFILHESLTTNFKIPYKLMWTESHLSSSLARQSEIYKPWLIKKFFGPVKMTFDQASTGYLQLAVCKTDLLQCLQLVIIMIKVHYNNPFRGSCHKQLLHVQCISKRSFHTTLTRATKFNLQSVDAVYFGNGN